MEQISINLIWLDLIFVANPDTQDYEEYYLIVFVLEGHINSFTEVDSEMNSFPVVLEMEWWVRPLLEKHSNF